MKLQASNVRFALVMLLFTAATIAAAQTSLSVTASAFRGIEGTRELSTAVSNSSSAATGSTEPSLPDAPSAVAAPQTDQATPVTAKGGMQGASTNESVGVPFVAANAILLGSTIANAEMITRCQPSACSSVPDSIRTRGALYAIGIPASVGITYISYRIKRGGSRWWILPVAVFTAGNAVYAVHAAQWSR
jgi:hypothetical protein